MAGTQDFKCLSSSPSFLLASFPPQVLEGNKQTNKMHKRQARKMHVIRLWPKPPCRLQSKLSWPLGRIPFTWLEAGLGPKSKGAPAALSSQSPYPSSSGSDCFNSMQKGIWEELASQQRSNTLKRSCVPHLALTWSRLSQQVGVMNRNLSQNFFLCVILSD